VNAAAVAALAREARSAAGALRHETEGGAAGFVSVSGVLADQLARELGAEARPGAVRVGGEGPEPGADVLVLIIAGDPTDADLAFVREADARGAPVVLVQLWAQADWARPFVLSPFVVECRAGEGFPVREIADRIVDASGQSPRLASAIPVLRESVRAKVVLQAVVRTAVLAALVRARPTRPLITLEQARMVARLDAVGGRPGTPLRAEPAALAGTLGAVLATGFALRSVARTARFVLPAPIANAAVAAGGTWALGRAVRAYSARSGT
jgi:uncharacterized protein (DUF697 family)